MANVVEAVEATLDKAGLHHTVAEPPAMCFLDLRLYQGDRGARGRGRRGDGGDPRGIGPAQCVRPRRPTGQVVGDGVMLYFPIPTGP
jgi:hypothetical protein